MSIVDQSKKDLSAELQAIIPESNALLESKGLDETISLLLDFEKKCRANSDITSLKSVCLHMVRVCRSKDWTKLNSTLTIINKRRAQSKDVIMAIVKESMTYVDETPGKIEKVALIKTLMEICEAKIYVEGESARLHLMLALIYEGDGNLNEACDTIQDVHVETYGSLTRVEKAEYILHQIRLNLLNKDYVRAKIQSRKMNRKTIDEAGFEDIKVKFYQLMVDYYSHEVDSWEMCQCFYKIYDTETVQKDESEWKKSLSSCITYLILSKFGNHQSDMMHRLMLLKDVKLLPSFYHILTKFTTSEVIAFPFDFQGDLEEVVRSSQTNVAQTDEFIPLLHTRVTQHNIRVLKAYYSKIRSSRMSDMLGLTVDSLEDFLAEMSSSGDLYVQIDRPKGIISFVEPTTPEEVLSDWSSSVGGVLSLLESTCHLINRENMVHNVK